MCCEILPHSGQEDKQASGTEVDGNNEGSRIGCRRGVVKSNRDKMGKQWLACATTVGISIALERTSSDLSFS